MDKLSQKAIDDLRKVLEDKFGKEYVDEGYTDEDLQKFGSFLLTIGVESLKLKLSNPDKK